MCGMWHCPTGHCVYTLIGTHMGFCTWPLWMAYVPLPPPPGLGLWQMEWRLSVPVSGA